MSTREALVNRCVLVKNLDDSVVDAELAQFLFDTTRGGNALKCWKSENTRVVLFQSHDSVRCLLNTVRTCSMRSKQSDGGWKECTMTFDLCTPENIPAKWVKEEGCDMNVNQPPNLIDFGPPEPIEPDNTQTKSTFPPNAVGADNTQMKSAFLPHAVGADNTQTKSAFSYQGNPETLYSRMAHPPDPRMLPGPDLITGHQFLPFQQPYGFPAYPPPHIPSTSAVPPVRYPVDLNFMQPVGVPPPGFDQSNVFFTTPHEMQGNRTPPPAYYSGEFVHGDTGPVPPNILRDQVEKESYFQQTFEESSSFRSRGETRIRVSNIPQDASEDYVLNFFENRRRSGGGDIENIDYNSEARSAVLTFQDPSVAERVLQKGPIMLKDNLLSITLYEESDDGCQSMSSASGGSSSDGNTLETTIEVKGFKEQTTEDTLLYYFENNRRSGGDEVVDHKIDRECSTAYFTFKTEQIVTDVLKRKHVIDGTTLEVKKYKPAAPPKPKQVYPDRVFLKNIASKTTRDGLFMYLEVVSNGNQPKSVLYGEEEGCALVCFEENIDFQAMQSRMEKKKLDGNKVQVQPVPISNSIIVRNIHPSTSRDSLQYYFENPRRAGGGDVQKVELNKEDYTALVFFEDCKVAEVVSARSHKLDGRDLQVNLFHECLGQAADEKPQVKIPDPVTLDIDKDKLQFIVNSQTRKEEITSQILSLNSEISWMMETHSLKLTCLLDENTPDCRKLVKSWKKNVETSIKMYFENIEKHEVRVLHDIWSELLEALKKIRITSKDSVNIFASKENTSIIIVGLKNAATKIKDEVESIKKSVEDEFERRKQQISEPMTDLKSYQVRLLLADKFHEKMHKKYSMLKIKITVPKNEILFTGSSQDIQSAQVDMYKMVNNVSDYTIKNLHSGALLLLQVRDVKDYIVKKLRDKKIVSVWDVNDDLLKVYGFSDQEVNDSAQMISSSVIATPMKLSDEALTVLSSPQWHSKKEQLLKQYPNILQITSSADSKEFWIICTDNIIAAVREVITDFLSQNTIYQKNINVAKGVLRFLYTHLEKDFFDVSKSLEHLFVRLDYKINGTEIQVRGTEDGIQKASISLNSMIQNVQSSRHFIRKPGIFNLMTSEKGQQNMVFVEKQVKCAIEVDSGSDEQRDIDQKSSSVDGDYDMVLDAGSVGGEAHSRRFADDNIAMLNTSLEMCAHCVLPNGLKVVAGVGDMTEMKVDVIVNAANKQLEHSGGLSKVIVSKGGGIIQRQCKTYIDSYGELAEGSVHMTTAGNLPCKSVIHAVGPVWQGGQQNEEENLWAAVITCLEVASKKGYKSISIPALSSGMYGYPIDKATKTIIGAIRDATKEIGDFQVSEVYVCDIKRTTVDHFVKAMEKIFGSKFVLKSTPKKAAKGASVSPRENKPRAFSRNPKENYESLSSGLSGIDGSMATDNLATLPVVVKLIKGDMAAQKVESIVNTTGCSLDLDSGAVSKAILAAAGPTIQTDCRNNYADGIQHGEVAVTTAGNLSSQGLKFIFHVALPNYDGTAAPQMMLKSTMKNCFDKAEQNKLKSIAFPAMGTGNLNYPRDFVSSEMYAAVIDYFKSRSTSIKEVCFIIYGQDSLSWKAFELEDERRRGKGKPRMSRQFQPTDFTEGQKRFLDVSEPPKSKNVKTDSLKMDDDMSFSFDLGSLTLLVKKGDITCEKAEALVNSSNSELDLKRGAVSQALVRKCGDELLRQCKVQKTAMAKDGIAVTAAKGLPGVELLIHVVAVESHKEWKNAIVKCLKKATEYNVSTVAFPAIGTNINMKPADMAKVMYEALISFSQDPSHGLKEVRLVVFREEMVSSIFAAINKCFEDYGVKPKSMLRKAAGFVGGLLGLGDKGDETAGFSGGPSKPFQVVDIDREEIILKIYSDNMENIENAKKHIDKFCDKEFADKHIMDEVIKMFTETQVAELKQYANRNYVNVIFEKRIGRIRLQGLSENVWKVKDELHSLMRRTEKAKHMGEEAEVFKSIVQWNFIEISDGEQLVPYDRDINYKLEKAYQIGESKLELIDNRKIKYIIDFVNMVDYPANNPNDKATVIRKDLIKAASFDKPANWTDMAETEILKVVQINAADPEFKKVEAELLKTVKNRSIVKIERIQNKTLYQQYTAKKASIDQQNPGKNNESVLWHGTAPDAIASINNYGFNRSYCGKNATVHGLGVYFARDGSYSSSDTYSRPDASGNKHIYQCRVLSGEYTKSNSSYRVPPVKSGHILYDTVVDNPTNPQIYVIFNDTQAYPDYLITFK